MDTAAAKKRIEAVCDKKLNSLFPHGIQMCIRDSANTMATTGGTMERIPAFIASNSIVVVPP